MMKSIPKIYLIVAAGVAAWYFLVYKKEVLKMPSAVSSVIAPSIYIPTINIPAVPGSNNLTTTINGIRAY